MKRPVAESMCQYGPDGRNTENPNGIALGIVGTTSRRREIEAADHRKEKGEMKDYMRQVKALIGMYVPPDPQHMQQAFQAGKVLLNKSAGYVQQTVLDATAKKLQVTTTNSNYQPIAAH